MPLTDHQRQQIRRYTGRTRINAQVDRTLENALDAVNALETSAPAAYTELVADIATLLTGLEAIDAQLTQSITKRQKFTKAEDVTFAGPQELQTLRQHGRQLVQRLCTAIAIPLGKDPFSGAPSAMGGLMKIG